MSISLKISCDETEIDLQLFKQKGYKVTCDTSMVSDEVNTNVAI